MPLIRHYDIEVEVSFRVRERGSGTLRGSMTLAETGEANSTSPQKMIDAVVAEILGETDKKIMSHARIFREQELKR